MSAQDRAWALWSDWCAATGRSTRDVSPEALGCFAAQVPGQAADLIRPAAIQRRILSRRRPDVWSVPERSWASIDNSLARCPAYGWPVAVAGRRDAWLLVATRVLRLPRAHAVGLRVRDLPGHLARLPEVLHGKPCHRCVSLRWLDVVKTYEQWSRAAVRSQVYTRPAGTWSPAIIGSAVPCDDSCGRLEQVLADVPAHTVLAPAIDRHGWWTHWRPMSPRALTTVLALRCDPYAAPADPQADPLELFQPAVRDFDDTTFERLDAAIDAAGEVNRRLEALLAEYDR